MSPRLLSFLSDIETALSAADPAPQGGTWQSTRTVNNYLGLGRLYLSTRYNPERLQPLGAVQLQSHRLADGSVCLKAFLSWTGRQAETGRRDACATLGSKVDAASRLRFVSAAAMPRHRQDATWIRLRCATPDKDRVYLLYRCREPAGSAPALAVGWQEPRQALAGGGDALALLFQLTPDLARPVAVLAPALQPRRQGVSQRHRHLRVGHQAAKLGQERGGPFMGGQRGPPLAGAEENRLRRRQFVERGENAAGLGEGE